MRRVGFFDSDGRPMHTVDRVGKRVRDDADDAATGFQPKAYTSSRSNRATASHKMYDKSSIMDYMDESDGLLGGKLSSLEGLDSFVRQASNISTLSQKTVATTNNHHPINQRVSTDPSSHYSAIAHVASSSSNSIGKKLLATMGWKLGHGIGPRMSSRRKSKKAATDIASSFSGGTVDVNDDDSVHPAVDLNKLPVASIIDSNSRIVSFAPSEVTITIPPPKVDMHGIGFVNKDCLDGGIKSSIFGNNGTLQSRRKSRYDIGFTYEEDDVLNDMYDGEALQASSSDANSSGALITSSSHHDISSSSSSSSKLLHYSNEVQDVDEDSDDDEHDDVRGKRKNNLGGREKLVDVARNIQNWTKRGHYDDNNNDSHHHLKVNKSCDESDGLGYLNSFSRPKAVKIVPYHYPPPVVPLDFDDRHRFGKPTFLKDDEVVQVPTPNSLGEGTYLVNNRVKSVDAVQSRAIMLNGNTSIPATASSLSSLAAAAAPSVFDLLKPADRIKIQNIHAMTRGAECKPPLPPPTIDPLPPPPLLQASLPSLPPPSALSSKEVEKPRPMLTSSSSILANSTFAALSQTFKNRFAPASSISSLHDVSRTTTAKEGICTAADYSKASSTAAAAVAAIDQSKATDGTSTTNNSSSNNNNSNTLVQQLIEIKSELKITKCVRTTTLWAPASLLCKRFNVKVPTKPSSSHLTQALITGARGVLNLDEQVKTIIDARVDQSTKNSSHIDHKSDKQRTIERDDDDNDDDSADVYLRPAASRVNNNSNPLSQFKSIFEDSDSSDSDSDDGNEDEDDSGDDDYGGDGKEEGNENEESATRNDTSAKIDSARATIVGDVVKIDSARATIVEDVVKIDACSNTATTTGQELKVVAVKYVKSSDRQTIAISRDGIGRRRNPLKSISSMHPPLSQLKREESGEGGGAIDSIRALDTANNNPTSNSRSVTDLKSETAEKRRFQLSFSSEEIDDDCGGIRADIDIINIINNKKVKHDASINHHRRSDKDGALQDQKNCNGHSMEQKDCNGHYSSSGSNPLQSSITTNQPHHKRPLSDKGAAPHYILDRFTQQHPFSSTATDGDYNRIAKESSHVVSINKPLVDTSATLVNGVSIRASISKLETYLHSKDVSDDDNDDDNDSGGKKRKQSKKNKHSKKSKRTKDNKPKEKKERHKKKKKSKKKKTRKVSSDSSSGSSSDGDSDDDDD